MNEEIPPYIAYMEGVGERLERTFNAALDRLATKDQLALLQQQLNQEREDRKRLERELKADEAERQSRMRRLWAGVWGVMSTIILATASIIGVLIATHH